MHSNRGVKEKGAFSFTLSSFHVKVSPGNTLLCRAIAIVQTCGDASLVRRTLSYRRQPQIPHAGGTCSVSGDVPTLSPRRGDLLSCAGVYRVSLGGGPGADR